MMSAARPLAYAQFLLLLLSFLCLTWAFIDNDFTVQYVATNSNSLLPLAYRISAVWGAHEGSLLLWVLTLGGWTAAVAMFSRRLPLDAVARVLGVLGLISVGFTAFVLFTSDPFTRTLPYFPVDGRDLNPLLQESGSYLPSADALHGLCGLLGGVCLCHCFADDRPSRCDLGPLVAPLDHGGLGIPDPGHSARLLVGLLRARLGRLVVLGSGRKRLVYALAGGYRSAALAGGEREARHLQGVDRAAGPLCLLAEPAGYLPGTLRRAGVGSCVCLRSDPRSVYSRFLLAVIGSSLLLFAFKGSQVKSHGKHELWSRETLLLCNNIMLVAGLLTVLLGTLLPLVHKELGLGSISIGTPFFNHIYSWLIIPFALLLGVGPLFSLASSGAGELKSKVVVALVLSLAAALLLPLLFAETFEPWAAVGIGLGAWIIVTSVQETWARATHKHSFAVGVRKLAIATGP